MSAVEFLAGQLETRYGTTTTWAQHILDELKAARFAVVELPEPAQTVDGIQWPVTQHWGGGNPDRDGYVTIRRDGRITALSTSNPHDCPSDARSLAAALLAAADAAEANA